MFLFSWCLGALSVLCGVQCFLLFFLPTRGGLFLVELSHGIRQPRGFHLPAACRTAPPLSRSRVPGDLGQAAAAQHGFVIVINVVALDDILVMLLDQQPLVPLAPRTPPLHLHQREVALQLLAVEAKLQVALGQHRDSFSLGSRHILPLHRNWRKRLPSANIPNHHRARAVIAFRDDALKIEIRNRMILHLHCQPLVRRIERRSLRHRPRFQDALHLEPKVIMQPRGIVLLHHEPVPSLARNFRRRLGRRFKPPFPFVFFQCHGGLHSNRSSCSRAAPGPLLLCRHGFGAITHRWLRTSLVSKGDLDRDKKACNARIFDGDCCGSAERAAEAIAGCWNVHVGEWSKLAL